MDDVVRGQQLRQLGLDRLQLSELLDIGELGDVDRTVLVLVEDQDVDDADRPGVDELEKLRRHLAGEVLRSRGELDHEVVDGAEVIEGCFGHRCPFPGRLGWFAYCRAIATRRGSSGVIRWSALSASSPRSICTQLIVPVKTLLSPS